MEVETDKAVFPVEATARGILHIGPFQPGDTVPVLTVVAIVGKPEDKFAPAGQPPAEAATSAAAEAAPGASVTATSTAAQSVERNGQQFASPRARKLGSGERRRSIPRDAHRL